MDASGRSGHTGQPVRRVMIVDDDPDIREVAQVALQAVGGWQVTSARSGREAVDSARDEPPDAILLDVMMPDLDGPATVAHLRDDPATNGIPIILLTAKTHSSDLSEWEGLGLAGIIAKPFDPMTLHEQVARLIGWKR